MEENNGRDWSNSTEGATLRGEDESLRFFTEEQAFILHACSSIFIQSFTTGGVDKVDSV